MKQSHILLLLGAGMALLLRSKPARDTPPASSPVLPVVSWPAEYRRAKTDEVTPLGRAKVRELVSGDSKPGDFVRFSDNGREYAVIIEAHYHESGDQMKPWVIHKAAGLLIKSSGA